MEHIQPIRSTLGKMELPDELVNWSKPLQYRFWSRRFDWPVEVVCQLPDGRRVVILHGARAPNSGPPFDDEVMLVLADGHVCTGVGGFIGNVEEKQP